MIKTQFGKYVLLLFSKIGLQLYINAVVLANCVVLLFKLFYFNTSVYVIY